jgi:hypothetical protein
VRLRPWLVLGLATALISLQAVQPARFTLAIVRLDGRLVPFAAYDGRRWERPWPEADEAFKGAPTIDEVPNIWRTRGEPAPRVWRVTPVSGAPLREARVTGADVVDAHCLKQVALTTNLPATEPVKDEHGTKFGVAVDSDLPIGAVQAISRSDAAWSSAERVVVANFDALEAARALAAREQVVRESPTPLPQMTHLYSENKAPRSPMYFIAEKKYKTARAPQTAECGAATIVTGWLMVDGAGTVLLREADVFLTDCDAKGVRRGLPLGAFRVATQLFWVLQEHGYEDETYRVAEIGPAGITYPITFLGGGC